MLSDQHNAWSTVSAQHSIAIIIMIMIIISDAKFHPGYALSQECFQGITPLQRRWDFHCERSFLKYYIEKNSRLLSNIGHVNLKNSLNLTRIPLETKKAP